MAGTQASLPQSHGAWEGNGEHNLSGLTHLLISTMAAVLRSSAGEGAAPLENKSPLLAFIWHSPCARFCSKHFKCMYINSSNPPYHRSRKGLLLSPFDRRGSRGSGMWRDPSVNTASAKRWSWDPNLGSLTLNCSTASYRRGRRAHVLSTDCVTGLCTRHFYL